MNGYYIGQWNQAGQDFQRVFQTSIAPFYDGMTSLVFCKICINILVFDDYLQKLYGDYTERGMSMQDIVIEKYGREANELLEKLL
ncbi:MAG: hypothetical protein LBD80_09310 [Tannerella sp.]|jgi:hypothetical protein|nr:hypothetical protein [Tannerella sp.]